MVEEGFVTEPYFCEFTFTNAANAAHAQQRASSRVPLWSKRLPMTWAGKSIANCERVQVIIK
jgi:hypothetical protein